MKWAAGAVTLMLGALLSGPASADCPGPGLALEPASPQSGQELTVRGGGLYEGICYDSNRGCRAPDQARPAEGLRLQLTVGGKSFDLGEFDPDDGWSRTKTVRLPQGAFGSGEVRALLKDGTVLASQALVVTR